MNSNNIASSKIDECDSDASEFELLLNRFELLLNTMNDESTIIFNKIYRIKDYSEPLEPLEPLELKYDNTVKESSILNELHFCLDTLEFYNNRLQKVCKVLTNLVG